MNKKDQFELWWKEQDIAKLPETMGNIIIIASFKEVAEKAFIAGMTLAYDIADSGL